MLDVLGDGVLRLSLEDFTGQPEMWIWLSSWTLNPSELEDIMARWKGQVVEAVSQQEVA